MAATLEWGGYTSAKEVALRQEGSQITLLRNMNKVMSKFPYKGKHVTHPPNSGKRIVKYIGAPELPQFNQLIEIPHEAISRIEIIKPAPLIDKEKGKKFTKVY